MSCVDFFKLPKFVFLSFIIIKDATQNKKLDPNLVMGERDREGETALTE